MKCHYPNCRAVASWVPVIELPTLRTAGDNRALIECSRPTTLLGKEICDHHRMHYNLTDWVKPGDWAAIQEAAAANGYAIPRPDIIPIQFRPIGWRPRQTLEVER